MGSTGTGSAESSNPGSHLGIHQRLRLLSGSLYEHIGGLRYRLDGDGKHRVEMYAGESSCIRIFRPADSDNVEAILFLPKPDNVRLQDIQSGLLERLGVIEEDLQMTLDDVDAVNQLGDKCTLYRTAADKFTGASPFVDGDLYELIRQYSSSLGYRYAQEGEKFGRAVGLGIGGVMSIAVNALILAGMSEPKLEHLAIAAVSTVVSAYVGSWFCSSGFGKANKENAHEILRKRLVKGHRDETNLHWLGKFIQRDYQHIDMLKTREQALDGAFRSLARVPAGEGLMIQWKDLPYDKIVERCEMLLGVRPVQYLPRGEVAAIIIPDVEKEQVHVSVPAVSLEVVVKGSVAPTKCPHCSDSLQDGDRCITGMMVGTPTQAHEECSSEMIASGGDWQPVSGAYAYESLVDHTTSQDKKKDERRVKE